MDRRLKKVSLGALVLALIIGITACGVGHGHSEQLDQEKILKKMTRKLDLNSLQQQTATAFIENISIIHSQMKDQRDALSSTLMENLSRSEIDRDGVNESFLQMETKFSQARQMLVGSYADFHASLDEGQQEKLRKHFSRFHRHHKR